ncbi:MAG: immunoglobulin-like domain-containing protein [Acutalibacteraceae bacterium]
MQKFMAFLLLFAAMFLGFFYDYGDSRLVDKLNPGMEQAEITSDKISIEIEDEVTTKTDKIQIKIVNHTGKYYKFKAEPDIEVFTNDGWYDVARSALINVGEIKGSVDAGETVTATAKGVKTYNIKKGYSYRIIMQFDDELGEIVTAEARFTVTK